MRRLRLLESERGSVAVAGMLLIFALALLIGAALDIAHAFVVRGDLAALADDAALVGAGRLDLAAWRSGQVRLDPQQAREAAEQELAANPGVAGFVVADQDKVTVEASRSFPTFALRLVGIPRFQVTVLAHASPETP